MTTHVPSEALPVAGRSARRSLDVFFAPETVAVFGATEAPDSAGRAVMSNLIRNPFGGVVFPISRTRPSVLGVRAYPRLADVPGDVDLAVVVTPAPTVPGVVAECIAAGVKAAVILSAGFGELGPAGAELERQIVAQLRQSDLRLLGPNCIGVACSYTGINATFAPRMVRPGTIGFISQSGSLLAALASGCPEAEAGCSTFLSVGSMIDVDWADCLAHLGDDPHTESIGVYVDALGDVASFLAAARVVTPNKPVVLLKARRAEGVARAANAGQEPSFDEALRRAGVLRVQTLAELFRMCQLLTGRPAAVGGRLAIVSNAAGPAALAADALLADGGDLAAPSAETVAALDRLLPAHCARHNPIDVGDDAPPERFARVAAAALQDPGADGLLAILTPAATIDPERTAQLLAELAATTHKPILANWLWGAATPASVAALQRAGIANFPCPDAAVRTFGYLSRHGQNLRGLGEAPRRFGPPHREYA
ncbi:MAG TPA: CoA-binding protein [Gemmataceae bacterium]|nr:CoA-binding protein [Gemmataceae bacterium]